METLELRASTPVKGRVGYGTMKGWLLDAYYEFCRHSGARLKWWHEIVLRGATHQPTSHLPIEQLMLCVVQLTLSAGRYPEADSRVLRWVAGQLERHGLANLLVTLPADEAS